MVNAVELHFVQDFAGIGQCLGKVGEYGLHLLLALYPFLFGIMQTCGVGETLHHRYADKAVVRLRILLVHKMGVVGGYKLYAMFAGHFYNERIHTLLFLEYTAVTVRLVSLMPLQLQVIVFAEHALIPKDSLFGFLQLPVHKVLRHFSAEAGGAYYQPFAVGLQFFVVGSRLEVITLGPGFAHQFHKVVVAGLVLGQHYKVVAVVMLVATVVQIVLGHIHLATQDRFELFLVALA